LSWHHPNKEYGKASKQEPMVWALAILTQFWSGEITRLCREQSNLSSGKPRQKLGRTETTTRVVGKAAKNDENIQAPSSAMSMSIDSKFSWDAMKDFSPVYVIDVRGCGVRILLVLNRLFYSFHPKKREGRLRQHLFKVYSTMTATLAMAAVGAWAHVLYNLGGLITLIATCGLIFALFGTPATKKNVAKRTLFLFGIGFFQGCSIGPLIGYSLAVDSGE